MPQATTATTAAAGPAMRLVTLFEYTGLAAALVGGLSVARAAWGEAFGCLVLVTVTAFVAALWTE
jgi:hypothetical protein